MARGARHGGALLILFLAAACSSQDEGERKADLVGAPKAKPGAEAAAAVAEAGSGDLVVDLFEDLVFRRQRDGWTLTTPAAHVNLEKLRKGGVDVVLSALPMAPEGDAARSMDEALAIMDELAAGTRGAARVVGSFAEAKAARARGEQPFLLLLEGADALVGRLDRLLELKKRGVVAVALVAGRGNAFADAAAAPRAESGLTAAGRELLAALSDAGLLADLTQASPAAFWDAVGAGLGPVLVSHTAARALREHVRNLDDLQILALHRLGGLAGLTLNPDFLRPGEGGAALADAVAHVLHFERLGALDALALGTDFGGIQPPAGLEDVSRLPALRAALAAAGLDEEEVRGVLGRNAARLLDEMGAKHGQIGVAGREVGRPLALECGSVIGESEGAPQAACDFSVTDPGIALKPGSRLKLRLKDVVRVPLTLELFGDPTTPWQVEGQTLEGRVVLHRIVQLESDGRASIALPEGRRVARLFLKPTRPTVIREAVVWGR